MSDIATAPLSKEFIEIDGKKMAFHQTGEGRPVVFLHGNPTSSYLWRNIIPLVSGNARCIAPDFIGMGDSEKLEEIDEDSYRYFQHRHYLDGFLDALELGSNVILVVHDWGSVLGLTGQTGTATVLLELFIWKQLSGLSHGKNGLMHLHQSSRDFDHLRERK